MVSGVSISACSMRCRAARTRCRPSRLGGGPHALDDGGERGVADGVEPGLEAGLGAGGDMGGDGGRIQVGDAGVGGVGVRRVEAGGVGAERAVDEEVAGGADRAELLDPLSTLRIRDVLGPVADDPRPGACRGERAAGR